MSGLTACGLPKRFLRRLFIWPFVFYGWLAAGIFALWGETIVALLGIEAEIDGPVEVAAEEAEAVPAAA